MRVLRPILLMTRPKGASDRFVDSIDRALLARVTVTISPLIRIAYSNTPLPLNGIGGVIFTSGNGVRAASRATQDRSCPAFCVGDATTKTAIDEGWSAQQCGQDAPSLIDGILHLQPPGPLLHIRGAHARGDVARRLTEQGLTCAERVQYDQVAQPFSPSALTDLASDAAVIMPVFSPRTAQLIRENTPDRPIQFVAISHAAAQALGDRPGWTVTIAASPDAHAMRATTENLLLSALSG